MEVSPLQAVSMYILLKRMKRRQRLKEKKRLWIQPLIATRDERGAFNIFYHDVVKDPKKFFNYFKMSIASFEELHSLLEESLRYKDTNMRKSISPKERLVVTLRYLASGCSLADLHYSYKIGKSTLSYIINDTCQKIWNILHPTSLPVPNEEKWKEIIEQFWERTNFPNCFGAIDGKHIQILKSAHSGSLYFNNKKTFSIVLLAVCDANYCFTLVDIRNYGENPDSAVFKGSNIAKLLASNNSKLPAPQPLPGTSSPSFPPVMVGNEAFALSKNIMRPYSGNNLLLKKIIFNYRLSRARRMIECTFGILSNKWRIFHRPIDVHGQVAINIVKACVVLHNFVIVRDGFCFEETLSQIGLYDFNDTNRERTQTAANIRDQLAEFFRGIGSVPWQMDKI